MKKIKKFLTWDNLKSYIPWIVIIIVVYLFVSWVQDAKFRARLDFELKQAETNLEATMEHDRVISKGYKKENKKLDEEVKTLKKNNSDLVNKAKKIKLASYREIQNIKNSQEPWEKKFNDLLVEYNKCTDLKLNLDSQVKNLNETIDKLELKISSKDSELIEKQLTIDKLNLDLKKQIKLTKKAARRKNFLEKTLIGGAIGYLIYQGVKSN